MEAPAPCKADSDRGETRFSEAVRTRRKKAKQTPAEPRQTGRYRREARRAALQQSARAPQNWRSYCRPVCSTKNLRAPPNSRKGLQPAGCRRASVGGFALGSVRTLPLPFPKKEMIRLTPTRELQ